MNPLNDLIGSSSLSACNLLFLSFLSERYDSYNLGSNLLELDIEGICWFEAYDYVTLDHRIAVEHKVTELLGTKEHSNK